MTTSDDTATAPGDYQSVQTTVTFEDGDTSPKLIKVPLVYSPAAEGDENFHGQSDRTDRMRKAGPGK